MNTSFLERVTRGAKGVRLAPPEVDAALDHASKQFQLWDLERNTFDDFKPPRGERIARERPVEAAGPGFVRIMAEATHAMTKLVPSSALAKKAWLGMRALKKIALRQPYKP